MFSKDVFLKAVKSSGCGKSLTISLKQISDSSRLKVFADDSLEISNNLKLSGKKTLWEKDKIVMGSQT